MNLGGCETFNVQILVRIAFVARIEQHTLAARYRRLRQDVSLQMVECLDDAGPRNELAEHFAGVLATEIDRLDAIGSERVTRVFRIRRVRIEKCNRIGAVDHNTTVPSGQTAQRSFKIDPAHCYEDDIGSRGFLNGASLDEGPSSATSLASDSGPRLFAIVAEIPFFASSRATLEPRAPAPIIPMLIRWSY